MELEYCTPHSFLNPHFLMHTGQSTVFIKAEPQCPMSSESNLRILLMKEFSEFKEYKINQHI